MDPTQNQNNTPNPSIQNVPSIPPSDGTTTNTSSAVPTQVETDNSVDISNPSPINSTQLSSLQDVPKPTTSQSIRSAQPVVSNAQTPTLTQAPHPTPVSDSPLSLPPQVPQSASTDNMSSDPSITPLVPEPPQSTHATPAQQPSPQQSTPANTQQTTAPFPSPQKGPAISDPTSDAILTDKIYPEDLDVKWNSWKCLVCEYVYEGQKPVMKCPRCGNDEPDKFDDPH